MTKKEQQQEQSILNLVVLSVVSATVSLAKKILPFSMHNKLKDIENILGTLNSSSQTVSLINKSKEEDANSPPRKKVKLSHEISASKTLPIKVTKESKDAKKSIISESKEENVSSPPKKKSPLKKKVKSPHKISVSKTLAPKIKKKSTAPKKSIVATNLELDSIYKADKDSIDIINPAILRQRHKRSSSSVSTDTNMTDYSVSGVNPKHRLSNHGTNPLNKFVKSLDRDDEVDKGKDVTPIKPATAQKTRLELMNKGFKKISPEALKAKRTGKSVTPIAK